MAIAFRASATAGTAVNPQTVTIPATVQTGDTMLLFTANGGAAVSTLTGWTLIRLDTGTGGSHNCFLSAFLRVAIAGDAGSVVSVPFFNTTNTVGLIAYSGTDTVSPVYAHNAAISSATGTTLTAPAVTTATPNTMIVEGFGAVADALANDSITAPATARIALVSGGSSGGVALAAAEQAWPSAGTTSAKTATSALTGSWVGQTIALVPPGQPSTGGFFPFLQSP